MFKITAPYESILASSFESALEKKLFPYFILNILLGKKDK